MRVAVVFAFTLTLFSGFPGATHAQPGQAPPPRQGTQPRPADGQGKDAPKFDGKGAATKLKVFVRGVCRGKEDEKPIVNAIVQFHIYRENPRRMEAWKTTRTDLDGQFTLEGEFPSDLTSAPHRAKITVRASGRASSWFFWQPDAKYDEKPVQWNLPAPAKLEGRVVDADGRPVAGAHVYVGSPAIDGINDAVSSKDGRFVIDDMEPWDARDEPAWSNGMRVTGRTVIARHGSFPKGAQATFDRVPAADIEIRAANK
jgi:hypothetical protein